MQRIILIIGFVLLIVSGCRGEPAESQLSIKNNSDNIGKQAAPIILPAKTFYKVVDWVTDQSFLYVQQEGSHASIKSYDIDTGKVNTLSSVDGIIVNASFSPAKRFLLLHLAVDSETAKVIIMDMESREQLWEKQIHSYDLTYEWNPFNESQILFTVFQENWEYKVWLADIRNSSWKEIENLPPFYKWKSKDSLLYQEWEENRSESASALMELFIENREEKRIDSDVLAFDFQDPYLLTVYLNNDKNTYDYRISQSEEEIVQFTMPGFKVFSDWVIPQHEFILHTNELVMFKPNSKGVSEFGEKTFSMVRMNLSTGEENVIKELADHAPLTCSPEGTYCLTGHKLSYAVNLENGETKQLIIYEEEIE
ncbi:hypothetical protein P6709_03505 [Jeotgalibacillus sp. ET6]|uniref:YqgU-like beta propeller domain-containing protein n=1 Tax=Jeotgalibacillus sp. ET6 TaxID=3037260 RepID=UPI00241844D5|nr:hypothetical protein [Jeotgalibacillus sp. ET6]MDG5470801.1 hypothetical protein [Jeotgalibacillus sp. ET6]